MLKSIAKMAMKSSTSLTKLANKGFIGSMIAGPIKQIAKPFLRLKWLLRADKRGRVNIFKNIARRMKVRNRAMVIQLKSFLRNPIKNTKNWIRGAVKTAAIGLAANYALKTLLGSNGDSKPSGSNAPTFDAGTPNITPGSGGTPSGGMDSTKTEGLINGITKNNAKAETAGKLAEAKAELTAATKAANTAKPFVSKVPSKLEEIHARGRSSDEKLDAIIKLLNQGNQIQNENRRSNEEQLKRQEQDIKNRLYKSSELYRNLTKLQAQQNSANSDAIKTGLASSGDKVSKALASQTSAYQSQAKEAKKSSMLKWLLFGGIALGISSIAKHLGGVGELISNGIDLVSQGFHGIGNMLGLLHEDNVDMAHGETAGETKVDKDEWKDEDYSKEDKVKDSNAIESTLDQNERLKEKIGSSADKAVAATTAAHLAKSAGKGVLKATKSANVLANNSATLKAEKALGKSMVAEQKAAVQKAKENLKEAKKSGDKKAIKKAKRALKSAKGDLKAAKELSRSATTKSAIGSTASKVKSTVTSAASAVKDTAVDMIKDSSVDIGVKKVKGGLKKVGSKVAKTKLGKFVTDRLVRILGAKIAAKTGGRLIPGLGIGIGVLAAGRRIMRGDWLGAFGEIASTTAAQLGELGTIVAPGVATAAGIGASLAIDSLVLMHDQRMAVEYAEKGDIKSLLSMGFEPADIAEMIYNAVDESGNPAPLNKNHPLRKNFESQYKSIISIASGKDIVPAIIFAQGILDHDAPLYKDYEKNYNSVQKLLDHHLSWSDIAEIVESSDPNGPLFQDFMKYYDQAVPAIMKSDSRVNDNSLVLGKIAQKSIGDFRKKFEAQYGSPKEFTDKQDKIKKSPLSKILRGLKWGSNKLKEGIKSTWDWLTGYASGTKSKGVDHGVSQDQIAFVGDRADDDSEYAKFNSKNPTEGKPEVIERVDGSVQVVGGDSAQGHLTILNRGDKVKPTVEPKYQKYIKDANARKGLVEAKVKRHTDTNGSMSEERNLNGIISQVDNISSMRSKINFAEGTAENTTPAVEKAKAAGWNIPDSINHLNSHAHRKSTSYCARYVRRALEAGGINTAGRPSNATDYDRFLPKIGFEYQDASNYKPQSGDICVIKANSRHRAGHISMYNGKNWVSDFIQNRQDGDVYNGTGGPLLYFRYKALDNSNPGNLSSSATYGSEVKDNQSNPTETTSFASKSIEDILGSMSERISMDQFKNIDPSRIQASALGSPETGIHTTVSPDSEGRGGNPISTAIVSKPIKSNITSSKSEESKESTQKASTEPQKTLVDNSGGNTIANSFNSVTNNYHTDCKIEQERNPLSNLMNS